MNVYDHMVQVLARTMFLHTKKTGIHLWDWPNPNPHKRRSSCRLETSEFSMAAKHLIQMQVSHKSSGLLEESVVLRALCGRVAYSITHVTGHVARFLSCWETRRSNQYRLVGKISAV